MSDAAIKWGDVYCPRCWGFTGTALVMHLSHSNQPKWECDRCGVFDWPFDTDENGRFRWVWDEQHPSPNPGCPWCRTRNIQWHEGDVWSCARFDCRKTWRGKWIRRNDNWRSDRWLIRIPVEEVPWASGTPADLECYRRQYDTGVCCRFPKSCSAFDPGFTTGKGPTKLPIVWNDGFGWRSGFPDAKQIPQHLWDQIWARWELAGGVRSVDDDD